MYSIKDGWTSSKLVFSCLTESFKPSLLVEVAGDTGSVLDDLKANFALSQLGD